MSMGTTGLPRGGDCYEVAALLCLEFQRFLTNESLEKQTKLCHGEPLGQGPIEGIRHGHAWVEFYDFHTDMWWVIDKSNGKDVEIPQVIYYNVGDIINVKRYDIEDVPVLLLEHGTYGPWEGTPSE